jgi:hypothetical protein
MKPTIRTGYRVVKATRDKIDHFFPQYRDEDSQKWHCFEAPVKGKPNEYVAASYSTMDGAIAFIRYQEAHEDEIVAEV